MKPHAAAQLAALKRQLKAEAAASAAVAAAANRAAPAPPPTATTDKALLAAAYRGVQPLRHSLSYDHPKAPRQRRPRRSENSTDSADDMSDFWPWDELPAGEALLYARPGQRLDTLRKLRRGQFRASAQLDLHEMNSDQARQAVSRFLQHCRERNLRCVRIIHGRGLSSHNGEPVLKLKLKNWLAQRPEVLAFCQASPQDGGAGAVLVLLKSGSKNLAPCAEPADKFL